ncbi:MAG: site-specific DNA-methyltransferase [Candidatus Aenigmarchaeota archaeon]|nr:site-specific DNA-methyltransferase [Candidatus Aenigmarchaeota archaeon]
MTTNFNQKLTNILKKAIRFVDEESEELIKNEIINSALKADRELIGLLIKDKEIRDTFFDKIEDYWIFNINMFIDYAQDKNFLSNSYTKFKNQIGLNVDGKFLGERGEVSLVWPFKDCVLEAGMHKEDQKRNEIFFNEILAKDEIDSLFDEKVLTNFKKFTAKGEEKVKEFNRDEKGTIKDNLIIKGNNLLALHSLKKEFVGKVKLIYIDPPYNTGGDSFKYNDKFNHSSWLTFMKNRLEIAKELLKNEGVLCVQCDDNEQAYLKVLLDEVMGKEQFETSFYVQVRYDNKTLTEDNDFQKVMEVVHVYSKSHNIFVPNKLKEEYSLDKFKWQIKELEKGKIVEVNGKKVEIFKEDQYEIKEVPSSIKALKETWATGSLIRQGGTAAEFLSKHLTQRKDGLNVLYKVYNMGEDELGYRYITGPKKKDSFRGKFYSGIPKKIKASVLSGDYLKEKSIPNLMYNYLNYEGDFGNCRHEGGVNIKGGKKPEIMILKFIEDFTKEGDLVLDYHLGSGTTCAVAHKMGRRYIGIEQLDYGENDSVIRLKNVIGKDKRKGKRSPIIEDYDESGISKTVNWKGGGDFIYCELMKYNEEAIEKIQDAKDTKHLLKIWEEMCDKYFLNYDVDIKRFNKSKEEFERLTLDKQKTILCEMLNKNQLYVNLSEINDSQFKVEKEDKELNKKFYRGN